LYDNGVTGSEKIWQTLLMMVTL